VGDFDSDESTDEFHRFNAELLADGSSDVFIEPFSRSSSSTFRPVESTSSSLRSSAVHSLRLLERSSAEVGALEGADVGRFRILGVLGEGRHATVFRAHDRILERPVALKVPRRGVLTSKALERFLGEAKSLARLQHPRLVPVYEAGRVGQCYYIAMALIEGHSLVEELVDDPPGIHRSAVIIADLAEALAYAHTHGVVHRDVKPANIRIDTAGAVYLLDFGIAYRTESGEVALPRGSILGTPAYIAPEQAQGGDVDALPASDQYSLGAVLYELLCGRPPFCGPPSSVLFHTIRHDPPSPNSVVPSIPPSLAAVCLKALAKYPDRRYSDCQDFAEDLRRWLRSETPLAYRRNRPRRNV
jgi:serine/threonine protein kinase